LGYAGITPSAAVEFNIYNNGGYAFVTDGATGTYAASAPVAVDGGNPINVTLTYINGKLTMTLQDTVFQTTFTTSAPVNIPGAVGGTTAYVGITGGDGGTASTQHISNFSFISLVDLRAQVSGSNIIVTWPAAVGGYTLQESASLTSPSWTAVPAGDISTSGGVNQATIPIGSGAQFFQLVLP
jgi:hypothetical protein